MNLREHFDIDPKLIYLNSGTMAITPRVVKAAQRQYQDNFDLNPAKCWFNTWEKMWATQKNLADFFNADPHDLLIRHNVTIALNEFIMGVSLPDKCEILASDLEYGAIVNICKLRAQKDNLSFRYLPLSSQVHGTQNLTENDIVQIIEHSLSPQTKLLLLSHVMTATGLTVPISKIGKLCHDRGVLLVVDGAHAPGAMPIDFSQLECDFYGANIHKWMMGPKGTGFGWINKRVKSLMRPVYGSWTTFETPPPFMPFGEGNRWTAQWMLCSSYDFSTFLAITDLLKFWKEIGPQNIWDKQKSIGQHLVKVFQSELDWPHLSNYPKKLAGPLYAFELPPKLEALNYQLMHLLSDEHNLQIAITIVDGKWVMRLAPQIYNTEEDVEKAATILKAFDRRG